MYSANGIERASKLEIKHLSFYYHDGYRALSRINMVVYENCVTALIGPSGCGKSTFLRCVNRMHDLYPGSRYEGEIIFDNVNILSGQTDVIELRSRIGMVFERPTPFPMSVFENAAYGLKLRGMKKNRELTDLVEHVLKVTGLWEEVKDRLSVNAYTLSKGQQQRLTIARTLAVKPDVILFDEPTTALDPISASKIEELIVELKYKYTVLVVTHNLQQAARISDWIGFMVRGELIEFDKTDKIVTNPSNILTEDYISGRFL